MAGQIIIVQKKITLNWSNNTVGPYEYVHVPALNVVHAREIIINIRMSQRNIAAGATVLTVLKGFYPDADDGNDLVGADLQSLNLSSGIATVPGVGVLTQVNGIPPWVRILTRVTQAATPVACVFTYEIEAVTRE